MGTTVYISAGSLKVVSAANTGNKLSKITTISYPLREGSIVNGILINDNEIANTISAAYKRDKLLFKDVTLVIDSSSVITKKVAVPALKPKDLAKIIQAEFVYTADSYEDLVYDAAVSKEGKLFTLFCCAVEKKIIDSYSKLFEGIGIKVKRIDVSLNTLIKFVRYNPELAHKNFVLNVIDGVNIISLLFEKGNYFFSTRSRLMEDRGTSESISELYSKLSSMEQFSKSQKMQEAIEASYYCGLNDEEIERLSQINPNNSIAIKKLVISNNSELSDYIIPISGCFTEKTDVDLATAQQRLKKALNKSGSLGIKIAGIAVALIACASVAIALYTTVAKLQKTVDGLKSYVEDPQNAADFDDTNNKMSLIGQYRSQIFQVDEFEHQSTIDVKFTSDEYNKILATCGDMVTIDNMSYAKSGGALTITASSVDAKEVSAFLTRLQDTGLFAPNGVSSTGFNRSSEAYTFTIVCDMNKEVGEALE